MDWTLWLQIIGLIIIVSVLLCMVLDRSSEIERKYNKKMELARLEHRLWCARFEVENGAPDATERNRYV